MRQLTLAIAAFMLFLLPEWGTDYSSAQKKARDENKYILINFSGSDWCIPCIRMHKELFDSKEFTDLASEKLVLVQADFPRLKKNQLSKDQTKKNNELADRYNKEGSFPLTLLLDKDGKLVKRWDGYPDMNPAQFVDAIKSSMNGVK
ncbi:MAG: thioredoxin family protein [Chitinophagaceae bacterium]|nr:thioredoxin family protein [Chitinophagaceae bacterium]